jgi:hemolysin activation/secretion protein
MSSILSVGTGVHLAFPHDVDVDLDIAFPIANESYVEEKNPMVYFRVVKRFF